MSPPIESIKKPQTKEVPNIPDWKRTSLLLLRTEERHQSKNHDHESVLSATEAIANAIESAFANHLTHEMVEVINLLRSRKERNRLTRDLEDEDTPTAPNTFIWALRAIQARPKLTELHSSSMDASVAQSFIEHPTHPFTVFCSDSHATTGHVLEAALKSGWFGSVRNPDAPTHTGVLSFDHHTDILKDSFDFSNVAKKENVMRHVLKFGPADKVCVVGISQEQIDTYQLDRADKRPKSYQAIPSLLFYNQHGQPKFDACKEAIIPILKHWKQQNITRIYPTIDMDGLRLGELGYTGTDYSEAFFRRDLLLEIFQEISRLDNLISTTQDIREVTNLKKVKEFLLKRFILEYLEQIPEKYGGLPASWIIKILTIAKKEYGFEIGIKHPTTGNVLVGDIVELDGVDYKGRTGKIAAHLMKHLLALAQTP